MARVRGVTAASRRRRIEVEGLRVDVDEDRHGADHHHGARGGHEGERRRDHLVARAHAHRPQRQQQRVGAGVDADPVAGAAEGGQLRLERAPPRAQDEAALASTRAAAASSSAASAAC